MKIALICLLSLSLVIPSLGQSLSLSLSSNCNGFLLGGTDFAFTIPAGVCVQKPSLASLFSADSSVVESGTYECDAVDGLTLKTYASSDCSGTALEAIVESSLVATCSSFASAGYFDCAPQCGQTDCQFFTGLIYDVVSCTDTSGKILSQEYAYTGDECTSNGAISSKFSCTGNEYVHTTYSDAACQIESISDPITSPSCNATTGEYMEFSACPASPGSTTTTSTTSTTTASPGSSTTSTDAPGSTTTSTASTGSSTTTTTTTTSTVTTLTASSGCNGLIAFLGVGLDSDVDVTIAAGACMENPLTLSTLFAADPSTVASGKLECDGGSLSFKTYASSDCGGDEIEIVDESSITAACGEFCATQCGLNQCEYFQFSTYAGIDSCSDTSSKTLTQELALAVDDCTSIGATSAKFTCTADGYVASFYADTSCGRAVLEQAVNNPACNTELDFYLEYSGCETTSANNPSSASRQDRQSLAAVIGGVVILRVLEMRF